MNGLTDDEKRQVLNYAANGADFYFIPSSTLVNYVVKNTPEVEKIAKTFRTMIIQQEPILIDPKMIVKYCRGKLDRKNTFVLDNGDIKVLPVELPKTNQDKKSLKKEINNE